MPHRPCFRPLFSHVSPAICLVSQCVQPQAAHPPACDRASILPAACDEPLLARRHSERRAARARGCGAAVRPVLHLPSRLSRWGRLPHVGRPLERLLPGEPSTRRARASNTRAPPPFDPPTHTHTHATWPPIPPFDHSAPPTVLHHHAILLLPLHALPPLSAHTQTTRPNWKGETVEIELRGGKTGSDGVYYSSLEACSLTHRPPRFPHLTRAIVPPSLTGSFLTPPLFRRPARRSPSKSSTPTRASGAGRSPRRSSPPPRSLSS